MIPEANPVNAQPSTKPPMDAKSQIVIGPFQLPALSVKLISLFLLLVLWNGTAWTARAGQIIGVNFANNTVSGANTGIMVAEDAAGAPGVRTTNWNNLFLGNGQAVITLGDGSIIDNSGAVVSGLANAFFLLQKP